jgi:hypothetical protein
VFTSPIVAVRVIAAVGITGTSSMMVLCRSLCGENGSAGGSFAFGAGGCRVRWVDGGAMFAGSVVAGVIVAAVGVTGTTSCVVVLGGSLCGKDGDGGCGGAGGGCWAGRFDGGLLFAGSFVAVVAGAAVFVTSTSAGMVVLGCAGGRFDGDGGGGGAGGSCWAGRFDGCLLFAGSFVTVVAGAAVFIAGASAGMMVLCFAGNRLKRN